MYEAPSSIQGSDIRSHYMYAKEIGSGKLYLDEPLSFIFGTTTNPGWQGSG
jgi:hypothetical protein